MKRANIILIIILLSPLFLSAQFEDKAARKFGFTYCNLPYYKQKKLIANIIEHYDIQSSDTATFTYMSREKFGNQPINGIYEIGYIEKKKDNYIAHKGNLKKKTIYIIDLYCADTTCSHCHIQPLKLISIADKDEDGETIVKGNKYQLSLYQIYKEVPIPAEEIEEMYKNFPPKDCKQGVIYKVATIYRRTSIYNNILLRFIPQDRYYESPNLKGLRYIPNNYVPHEE